MKKLLFFIFIITGDRTNAQYQVDTNITAAYRKVFQQAPDHIQSLKDTAFRNGLGLLTNIHTDTLNKEHLKPVDTSLQIFIVNKETGIEEPLASSIDENLSITTEHPAWLTCRCRVKGDTLEIAAGRALLSGFGVTAKLTGNSVTARYNEFTKIAAFRTTKSGKMVDNFDIPATVSNLVLNRKYEKGQQEIFGKLSVTSSGFFSYLDASAFTQGYQHKRMRLEFYFRCSVLN
ncbi:hypothetical protein [Flavihumibacter petaseus]|uniref:Uncharacterized protein n=1 Tax=Flavihumibacter petaseus NBRC 106054 TaxID=1220578 RepID=A0A0E9N6Y9_9BACT|nr:hypothetical protein [Flavihumibacter petaseus]GAO45461.1 hypothetical protein FPE01S_05_01560 [Flavihumibacter petaseus NBRC 106054]